MDKFCGTIIIFYGNIIDTVCSFIDRKVVKTNMDNVVYD